MSINFDDLESRPGFFATSKPKEVTFLPDPERRPRHFTFISVDDHLVEPPDMFEGRVPARFADLAPRVEIDDTGMEYWLYDGERQYKVGLNAVVGPAPQRAQLRADPLRRDAPRRLGHPRPGPRHGPQRRLRLAQLPVVARRASPGSASSSACPTPSSRSRSCGRPTTGTSRSGPGPTPSASSRCSCRGCSTPRSPPPRSGPTPSAASGPSPSPSCPSASACRRCTPATGTRSWPRAPRPARSCASTSARRRARR